MARATVSLLIGASFVLGLGSGALLFRESDPTQAPTAAPPERQRPPRADTRSPHETRFPDPSRIMGVVDSMEVGEISSAIETLAAASCIKGIEWTDRLTIKRLVSRWYREDPETALAWVNGTINERNRQFYLEAIAFEIGEKDIDASIDFLREHLSNPVDDIEVGHDLVVKAVEKGPATVVELCKLTMHPGAGGSGMSVPYPEDFDFQATLNQFAEIATQAGPGERFGTMPSNLLAEWAKRDPQQAYEWALMAEEAEWRDKLPFNNGTTHFFQGYADVAEPADYAQLVAEFIASREDSEIARRDAFEILSAQAQTETVDAYLHQGSTAVDSPQAIEDLLDTSQHFDGGDFDSLQDLLFTRLSEQQQLDYLARAPRSVAAKLDPFEQLRDGTATE